MPLANGQVLRGRYQIQMLLGQGGFGTVYQAIDLNLQRAVAVKENLDASVAAQRQFQREAQLLVHVRHANLPQILDYFIEANGQQYLVMEFVAGSTLRQLVQQRNALSEAQVLPWANQILDALNELHTQPQPIIHRDIKPDNIIITPRNNAMLVDFGIAKAALPGMPTTTGARAVSPGYSPPEQYGNAPTDTRSDIYALGATLYFALTNVEPPESIQRLITSAPLVPPRQYNARISQNVESAILKAMETNPANRYQSDIQLRQAMTQPLYVPPVAVPVQPAISAYVPPAPTKPIAKPAPAYTKTSWRDYMVKPIVIGIGIYFVLSLLLALLLRSISVFYFTGFAALIIYFAMGIFVARGHHRANNGSLELSEALRDGVIAGSVYSIIVWVLGFILRLFGLFSFGASVLEIILPLGTSASLIGLFINVVSSIILVSLGAVGYRAFVPARGGYSTSSNTKTSTPIGNLFPRTFVIGLFVFTVAIFSSYFVPIFYGIIGLGILAFIALVVSILAARQVRRANGGVFSWGHAIRYGMVWAILFIIVSFVLFLFGRGVFGVGLIEALVILAAALAGTLGYRLVTGE